MPALTIKDLVLLHLSKYRTYRDRMAVPYEITQDGIASAVGVKRAHISVELKRMREERGWILEKKAHAGHGNKKKVYFLTQAGEERLSVILSSLRKRRVTVEISGTERQLDGPQAVEQIVRTTTLSYPLAVKEVMSRRRISVDEIRASLNEAYSTPIPETGRIFGRDRELKDIRSWYGGKTPILAVIGLAGSGKSALVSAFVRSLRDPVFWYAIEEWSGVQGLIKEMEEFLRKNGEERAASALSNDDASEERFSALRGVRARILMVFDDFHKANDEVKKAIYEIKESICGPAPSVKMMVISRAIPSFYTRKDIIAEHNVRELFVRGLSKQGAREVLKALGTYPGDERFEEIYSVSSGYPLILQMVASSPGFNEKSVMEYLSSEFYEGLPEGERRMLARLSVFREPVPPQALIYEKEDADLLNSLISKGMIHYDKKNRYFTHDLIKAVLTGKEELEQEHCLASEYYANAGPYNVEEIYHLLMCNPERAEEVARMKSEYLLQSERAEELLEVLEHASDTPVFLSIKARGLAVIGRIPEALRFAEEAVERSGDEEKPFTLLQLGMIYRLAGRVNEAEAILQQALTISRTEYERNMARMMLGNALFFLGKYDKAEALGRESAGYFRENGYEMEEKSAMMIIAMSLGRRKRYEEAISILKDCADAYDRLGQQRILGNTYLHMGMYEAYLGKREDARRHFEMSALYGELTGSRRLLAYSLMNSADNYIHMGDTEKALAYVQRARDLFIEMGDRVTAAVALATIVDAQIETGEYEEARKNFVVAERELKDTEEQLALAELYQNMAGIEQEKSVKKKYYSKALEIYARMNDREAMEEIEKEMNKIEGA